MGKRSPNSTDAHIGKRIRMLRLTRGLSQTDLGNALNITFQQVQKYENGHNRVGAGRLQEVANFLGVPPAFFFEDGPRVKGGKSADTSVTELLSNKDSLALAQAFDKIRSRGVRNHVVEFVESLAKGY